MTRTPRIVTLLALVAALAAANHYTPGLVEAVLLLTALYLVVTHSGQVNDAFSSASAGLARGFGVSPPATK
jgi:hypothetical protein